MSAADYLQRHKYRIFFAKIAMFELLFLQLDVILLSN